MTTAQELVRSDPKVYDALAAWMMANKSKQTVEQVLPVMKSSWWSVFCKSTYARELKISGVECALYSVGTEAPVNLSVPVTCACGWIPTLDAPLVGGVCATCRAYADEEKAKAERHRLGKPVRTAKPEIIPTIPVQPAPALTSTEQGLFDLIARGLKASGFTPEQAVTAEQCKSIAESAALEVADLVREQLKAEGLGVKKQIIVIKEGKTTREVTGQAPAWFPRLLKLAACRVPALLVGPPGSGKTTAFKLLAERMELPFHRVSIAAGTDEGQLQGWLHPVGDHMKFEYVASVVSTAYEQGGVVLIDDIDLGDPNALGILNAALDNGGWHIPLRHANPVFHRHANAYIGGAANTWGHGADRRHSGANQLDERTLSRFRLGQIWCDYDSVMERGLYDAQVVDVGHMIRARLEAIPGSTRYLSTRDIESAHTLLEQFALSEIWYGYFADWSQEELQRIHVKVSHSAMTAKLD